MSLSDLVKQHALIQATQGNWSAVANTIKGLGLRETARLCYAVESGTAVTQAGGDPTAVLEVMLQDPNGLMLFQKLSSSAGVQWAHPVTISYLSGLVTGNVITQQVMDALLDLSAPRLHATLTATECQQAYTSALIDDALAAVKAKLDSIDNAARTEARREGATPLSVHIAAQTAWESLESI